MSTQSNNHGYDTNLTFLSIFFQDPLLKGDHIGTPQVWYLHVPKESFTQKFVGWTATKASGKRIRGRNGGTGTGSAF